MAGFLENGNLPQHDRLQQQEAAKYAAESNVKVPVSPREPLVRGSAWSSWIQAERF
jgi:hypothetical protein